MKSNLATNKVEYKVGESSETVREDWSSLRIISYYTR